MEAQNLAYQLGHSQKQWPNGNHNFSPSHAVDVAPYPLPPWAKTNDFLYFGGQVMGIAKMLLAEGKITHAIRYGMDWDNDNKQIGKGLADGVHFELIL